MPPRLTFLLVAFCVALNAAGFLFHLFEPVPLYDELAHFITPFTLVALVTVIIYRWGGGRRVLLHAAEGARYRHRDRIVRSRRLGDH
jgi:hypothetical protein